MTDTSIEGIMARVHGLLDEDEMPWRIPDFVRPPPRRRKYQRRIKQPRRIAGRLQPKRRRKS